MKEQSKGVAHLLWTSGWDSTFRLLQLLLIQHRRVQPYYLIDPYRASTGLEIKSMRIIKTHLFSKYAETKDLILPTVFKEVLDLQPNNAVTDKYHSIKKRQHIGSQYEWFAMFCEEQVISGMELGIHRNGNIQQMLDGYVVEVGTEDGLFYQLDAKMEGSDYDIFKYYRFPLFNLSKLDMQRISKEKGWEELLDLTWFCHRPRPDSTACGICIPCVYTIKEGLGMRIPVKGRLRYYPHRLLLPVKERLKYYARRLLLKG